MLRNLLFVLFALVLSTSSARCQSLSTGQLVIARQIQNKLAVIKDLSAHKLITTEEQDKASNFYLDQATPILGHAVTEDALNTLTTKETQTTHGFGVFLNSIIILAGILLLLSAIGLILFYLRDFLKSLPSSFYECMAYVLTAICLAAGYLWQPFHIGFLTIEPFWLSVPGAFAFAGCVNLSYWLHWIRPRHNSSRISDANNTTSDLVYFGPVPFRFPTILFGLCTIVWGAVAVEYHAIFPNSGIPNFLAFISIIALQSFLGFSVITAPGCIALGWEKDKQVPKSTLSSLMLLVAYVSIALGGIAVTESMRLFESGCLFMGAFVYYLGLLVMSSQWYSIKEKIDPQTRKVRQEWLIRYFVMQTVTIISGLTALYLGATFHIGALLGIGGTFFVIYLLGKYYEIPWKGVGWAWSCLGVALALYFFVGFAGQHAEYFIWGIK
jgi:hypothetical protein